MGFTPTEKIWFNGKLVAWDDAKVHVLAHGLQYGTGVFEGMKSYPTADGPAIFRLDAHLERFYKSAELYDLEIPYPVGLIGDRPLVWREGRLYPDVAPIGLDRRHEQGRVGGAAVLDFKLQRMSTAIAGRSQ